MTSLLVYLSDLRFISEDVLQLKTYPGKSKLQVSDE